MITIAVRTTAPSAFAALDNLSKNQIPYATAVALTRTAGAVQEGWKTDMARDLDKPTRYTLAGTYRAPANKHNLTARVGVIDSPRSGGRAPVQWMATQATGGDRPMTGMERALQGMGLLPSGMRAVPGGGVKLDAYGNIPRKTVVEVLGVLRANLRTSGNLRVHGGRGKRAVELGYFVARAGASHGGGSLKNGRIQHLEPGVYRRTERAGNGRIDSSVAPILLFVAPPRYQPKWHAEQSAKRVVTARFGAELTLAAAQASATAR